MGLREMPIGNSDELRRVFARFDADGDGSIDLEEFRAIIESLGENPSDEVLSLEFAAIDTNADGKVELQEFVRWWLDDD